MRKLEKFLEQFYPLEIVTNIINEYLKVSIKNRKCLQMSNKCRYTFKFDKKKNIVQNLNANLMQLKSFTTTI